jgi:hypothetical protein
MVQPFTAEKKVIWSLLGSTATAGVVCFIVAMAMLELVEGTDSFPPSLHRNTELLTASPAVLGSIGAVVVVDNLRGILSKDLLLLLMGKGLDLDVSHGKTSGIGR